MLQLPWENDFLSLPTNPKTFINVLEPGFPKPLSPSRIQTIIQSGIPTFSAQIKQARRIAVILEDPSRPSRTSFLIEKLINGIQELRGSFDGLSIVIAAGAHYNIQIDDLVNKLGHLQYPSTVHDCLDPSNLSKIGESKSGVPLIFNTSVVQADIRIPVGTVNIHPLAGFSGGGKILLPGVAGLETIKAFHHLPGGNPGEYHTAMRRLINEVLDRLPLTYSWHLISNPNGEIINIYGGEVQQSHQNAQIDLLKLVQLKVSNQKTRLLLLGCKPFNQNLIGTFKSFHQISKLLSPGGQAILFNEAPQGIGFHHWRLEHKIIQEQKEHFQQLFKDFKIAIYSPETTPADFYRIFPEQFTLLKTVNELEQTIHQKETFGITVLPYAPITFIP